MKKILFLSALVILAMALCVGAFAASVSPILHPGNDANSYTPPEGCIRTTLPESDVPGTHVYTFNDFGQLDSAGSNTLTVVIGTAPGTSYTRVLSWTWSGSYPLYSIIVKGGPNFNEYVYDGTATNDTNLVSPIVGSGQPADISHVSVVLCPEELPPTPPDGDNLCCIFVIILLVLIAILLIAILIHICNIERKICHDKHHPCDNNRCFK